MNIGVIIAGGSGQRMHQEIPKQFMNVNDKPVIVYTLEAFERHEILWAYAKQYKISKLKWIVSGGENVQGSIRNGVFEAEKRYGEDDILLIHDAVRPLVSQEILSDCIVKCRKYGSAVVTVPCNTVILKKKDELSSEEVVDRQELAVTQTPQAFPLHKLVWAHKEALKRGITNSVASCTLMTELGESVYFSVGAETNIKLTTQDDLMIFKALLAIQEQKGKY